jgi:hypothetical protein
MGRIKYFGRERLLSKIFWRTSQIYPRELKIKKKERGG